jgi:hypothetical protein
MSYKVIIELEFETYKPKTEDIIKYINELKEDIDYKLIDNSKQQKKEKTNEYISLTQRPKDMC